MMTSLENSIVVVNEGNALLVVFPKGTTVPATFTAFFITQTETQTSIEIELAELIDNVPMQPFAVFKVAEIPTESTSKPLIEVTFKVARPKMIVCFARDHHTGQTLLATRLP